MSIYSGFATRQQEQAYDSLVADLIEVLQRRIVKFYAGQQADEGKFYSIINNIQHHLIKMQESKYLEPKMSGSFRQLLAISAAVAANSAALAEINQQQHHSQQQQRNQKQPSLPKQSLSFSSDKLQNDLKSWGVGRIKHQVTSKDDLLSSRGQANPEFLLVDKNVKRAVSTHFSKASVQKRELQRWAMFDNEHAGGQQMQKKSAQYVIREYVKGQHRRRLKKRNDRD